MDTITALYEATSFPFIQGGIIAAVATLGYMLIRRLPKHRFVATALLLGLITPLATLGFWFSTGDLGISDWDYYFSLHTTHRNTLLTYNQFPHWNPYICGGTAGLADPEFRLFTPTFLLQLAFGIPVGFRLAIWLSVGLTAIGILTLGRKLKISLDGGFLAAIASAFGTVTLLEIVEGHPNVFAAMFIPWIFWAWYSAYVADKKKSLWYITTGAFLALTFFQGGIYLLMYTAIAFAILPLLARRKIEAVKASLFSGIWGLGFAAIKIIPVFLWLLQFQDQVYASSALTLPYLNEIFFGRHLHGSENVIPEQGGGWHEYGAYIGYGVAVLALIGAAFKRKRRLVQALVVTAILATLLSSTGPQLKPFFDQASFFPRSNISRVILFAIIPISLLAGFGLDVVKRAGKQAIGRLASVLILLIIFGVGFDLFSLSYPLSEQAFVLPRVVPQIPHAPDPIGYSLFEYKTRSSGNDYDRSYEAILQGYGTFTYCSVLTPAGVGSPLVKTIHDEEDKDIISFSGVEPKENTFTLISWTPNIVTVEATLKNPGSVVLNANYAKGWSVNGAAAEELAGRVATAELPAGSYTLVYQFKTPGFPLGASISVIALLLAVYTWRRPTKSDTQDLPHE